MANDEYLYDAFISYRHSTRDKLIADRLQKLLEKYVPPKAVKPEGFKKMRVFRDETELPTSGDLGTDIKTALEKSRYLIVLCGPTYTQSKWCMEELTYFKKLRGGSIANILTILIEGDPHEVFPEEICYDTHIITDDDGVERAETVEIEPLAANVTASTDAAAVKRLNREFLRMAAPMLNCGYDDLYNRNHRRFMRRVITAATAVFTFLVAFIIYTGLMLIEIDRQRGEAVNNYNYAKEQEQEARRQEELAIENLNQAKALLLSGAMRFAGELSAEGARNRAVPLLIKAYESIDRNRAEAGGLLAEFTEAVLNTLHYDDELEPVAKIDLRGEILQINAVTGQQFALVTTADAIYKIDIDTGDIISEYKPPEGERFFGGNRVHGQYVIAFTNGSRVMVIDTVSDRTADTMFARHYEGEKFIAPFTYNEDASAIIVHTQAEGVFADEPDSAVYIENPKNELFRKYILTVIPCDLDALSFDTDNTQIIAYKGDIESVLVFGAKGIVSLSGNGRFFAFQNNYAMYTKDDEYINEKVNSEITVIDFNRFDKNLSPSDNKEAMATTVDCRFNGEDNFFINKFFIGNLGALTIDGEIDGVDEETRQRTIVYNYLDGVLVYNEQLQSEYYSWDSGIVSLGGQNYFSGALAEYDFPTTSVSEHWLLYLDDRSDGDLLKVVNTQTGEVIFGRDIEADENLPAFELPGFFDILGCFLYSGNPSIDYMPNIAVIGNVKGERGMGLLFRQLSASLGNVSGSEFYNLDVVAAAAAVDIEHRRMYVGYKDGKALIFAYAPPLDYKPANSDVRYISYDGEVVIGVAEYNPLANFSIGDSEKSGVFLQKATDDRIRVMAYSKDFNYIFGYEDDPDLPYEIQRVYSIWDLNTGNIVKSFYGADYMEANDEGKYDGYFRMRINADFTYAIAATHEGTGLLFFEPKEYTYRVVDTATGEVLHTYVIPEVFYVDRYIYGTSDNHSGVFYGIGENPEIIWLYHVDTLMLEEINAVTGERISERYLSERMPPSNIFYDIGGDLMVFDGGFHGNAVYSLTLGRKIYTPEYVNIVQPDVSATYYSGDKIYELTPEGLYQQLKDFKHIGELTDTDIEVSGMDIWGR